ncbi:hypothetical protein B0T10DRAFT_467364 [Thelonectria olida]|uniref:Extracellular membrane protein CFEM domain-containing protein n=1 Tax=Thelonectria olida TaxID=1576542 RepID=A0A9P9AI47_9HYPO|nr:hypothetical protein B0T10DRAFT_467364 [Thelonectria olida]
MQQLFITLLLAHHVLALRELPNLVAAEAPEVLACSTIRSIFSHCSSAIRSDDPATSIASCLCCDSTTNIDSAYVTCASALETAGPSSAYTVVSEWASLCITVGDSFCREFEEITITDDTLTSATDPPDPTTDPDDNSTREPSSTADAGSLSTTESPSPSPPVGAIVGGVIGGIAVLALLAYVLYLVLRLRRQDQARRAREQSIPPSGDGSVEPKTGQTDGRRGGTYESTISSGTPVAPPRYASPTGQAVADPSLQDPVFEADTPDPNSGGFPRGYEHHRGTLWELAPEGSQDANGLKPSLA